MDSIDKCLIAELRHDARISNVDLARRVNLSPTPCLRRVKKLEESGVIRRYEAVLNPESMGLDISAFVFIKLTRKSVDIAEAFEREISQIDAVTECNVITGSDDYLLRIVATNLKDYELVLKKDLGRIESIANIKSTIILNQVECSGLTFTEYRDR